MKRDAFIATESGHLVGEQAAGPLGIERLLCRVAPIILLVCILLGCDSDNPAGTADQTDSAVVADYMRQFEGRGQQVDASEMPSPESILDNFHLAPGLAADLVLAEPAIHQPVEVEFDHRGRLWVVQYSQYPYPAGLKVTDIDHHIRMTFDKVPEPPPAGVRGADKITFFEDTDGDGSFDRAVDAIDGLNIVTSVAWGRGKIWVLNPPYLLAYPDDNDDGLPDGDPKVCVRGFGLEDTHAVANSLMWGPDGWLYGATGSTTHQYISTRVTQNLHYKGQGIWRYHPETEVFELFAEGGGNTFHVEMDDKGRIYSGTNGTSRGQYYKQGGYYTKNWGKHGALTNDYAYGYLPDMHFSGKAQRFTHAWVKYQSDALPHYRDQLIAINPLHHYVQASTMTPNGSSFATTDVGMLLESSDRWFRPVDIKVGPDGAIYLADWSDSRLSHVNPRDDWHKTSGRIYRIRHAAGPGEIQDLSPLESEELVQLLDSPEKWHRQQALRLLADRQDATIGRALAQVIDTADAQLALEYLWAAAASSGISGDLIRKGLGHKDPYVRSWTIRLTTDEKGWDDEGIALLLRRAEMESHPEVISQMACSAKRMKPSLGLAVLWKILPRVAVDDPDNPLLIWWALEHHLDQGVAEVTSWLKTRRFWDLPVVQEWLLARIMQRALDRRTPPDLDFATLLFKLAPSPQAVEILANGFLKGASNIALSTLPEPLLAGFARYTSDSSDRALELQVRQQNPQAVEKALVLLTDPDAGLATKLTLTDALGGNQDEKTSSVLLQIMRDRKSPKALIVRCLQSLSRDSSRRVGEAILDAYPDHLRSHPVTKSTALYVLCQRTSWGTMLLDRIVGSRQIEREDLMRSHVLQLALSIDKQWETDLDALWPHFLNRDEEQLRLDMEGLAKILKVKDGDPQRGRSLFSVFCGTCHRLHDEGHDIGPDLTGYDRSNTEYLIAHTLDPDLDIREGYVQFSVRTLDDRNFIGVLTERSNRSITLQPFMQTPISFDMEQIDSLQPLSHSLMPTQILEGLPDDQIRDLFSYLQEME
ncbi:MAG: c-type cytochrome [Saprospiraceae bacterium]|nr:c-type cytochrome [Saprospiraceae bacterium]